MPEQRCLGCKKKIDGNRTGYCRDCLRHACTGCGKKVSSPKSRCGECRAKIARLAE